MASKTTPAGSAVVSLAMGLHGRARADYRGTSLIRNCTPSRTAIHVGPYAYVYRRVLGAGVFL